LLCGPSATHIWPIGGPFKSRRRENDRQIPDAHTPDSSPTCCRVLQSRCVWLILRLKIQGALAQCPQWPRKRLWPAQRPTPVCTAKRVSPPAQAHCNSAGPRLVRACASFFGRGRRLRRALAACVQSFGYTPLARHLAPLAFSSIAAAVRTFSLAGWVSDWLRQRSSVSALTSISRPTCSADALSGGRRATARSLNAYLPLTSFIAAPDCRFHQGRQLFRRGGGDGGSAMHCRTADEMLRTARRHARQSRANDNQRSQGGVTTDLRSNASMGASANCKALARICGDSPRDNPSTMSRVVYVIWNTSSTEMRENVERSAAASLAGKRSISMNQ